MNNNNVKFKIVIAITAVILIFVGILVYNYFEIPTVRQELNSEASEFNSVKVSGPRLEVSPESFDFGTVVYGEVAEQSFELKNIGSKALEILRLSTSCGCTKAKMAEGDKVIAPGESVKMEVSFDPAVHKDDSDLGELTRVVYIRTNDSEIPETEVEIFANVVNK